MLDAGDRDGIGYSQIVVKISAYKTNPELTSSNLNAPQNETTSTPRLIVLIFVCTEFYNLNNLRSIILKQYQVLYHSMRDQPNCEMSWAALKESRIGIEQKQSLKRVIQNIFVFIPVSFVISAFGMNTDM
jgi:hypothetical protein